MIEQLNCVHGRLRLSTSLLIQQRRTPQAELSSSSLGLCVYVLIYPFKKTFVQFVYIPDTMQGFEDVEQSKEAMRVTGLFCNFFFFLTFTFCRDLPDFSFGLENKKYIKYKDFSRNTKLKGIIKHHFYLQKVN